MQSHTSNNCTDGQSKYVAKPKTETKFVSFYFVYNCTSLEIIQSQMHTRILLKRYIQGWKCQNKKTHDNCKQD